MRLRLASWWFLWLFVSIPICTLAQEDPLLAATRGKQVIFLGERHTSELDHIGQLEALKFLAQNGNSPLVVAAEMFNETATEELLEFAESPQYSNFPDAFWKEQWGHPYEFYRDIFKWVKSENHQLTFLRPDPEKTRRIKEEGVLAALPMVDEFFLGPKAYRDHMIDIAAEHLPEGEAPEEQMVDAYFLVQCFWDEYMSWRLAHLLSENPGRQIVVLVGHGHLNRDFGIPPRLTRRAPSVEWLTVGFGPEADWNPQFIIDPSNLKP
jgi:uncharacterized iron-regulated protein